MAYSAMSIYTLVVTASITSAGSASLGLTVHINILDILNILSRGASTSSIDKMFTLKGCAPRSSPAKRFPQNALPVAFLKSIPLWLSLPHFMETPAARCAAQSTNTKLSVFGRSGLFLWQELCTCQCIVQASGQPFSGMAWDSCSSRR